MEGAIIVLGIVIVILLCFIVSFVYDTAFYKGQAETYERMLIKAGLIDEPPVVEESGQPSE